MDILSIKSKSTWHIFYDIKSFFYAKVAIGQAIKKDPDNKIRVPPLKPNQNGKLEESFDSILGFTNNSDIFIIYENSRAYPQYLITYKE